MPRQGKAECEGVGKIRNKRTGAVALCAVCTVVIISLLLTLSVSAAFDIDASREGFSGELYNETLTTPEMLEELFGISFSSVEREYLAESGVLTVSYPKSAPTSYVEVEHHEGTLTVTAHIYTYVAADGTRLTWIPATVTVGGVQCELSSASAEGDAYSAEMPAAEMPDAVSVSYCASLALSAEAVNAALSQAYGDGAYYAYVEAMADYDESLAAYKSYLVEKQIYDELYEAYRAYLAELAEYNAAVTLYGEYLSALEKYKADYAAYLENEAKRESLADEIAEYEAYLAALELAEYRLSLVEDSKVLHEGRSLYNAVFGDMVTQVIENKDLISSGLIGVDAKVVDKADKATKLLRRFFTKYYEIDSPAGRYEYYKNNYARFRDCVVDLFVALDELYKNNVVKSYVAEEGRTRKFEILLSQLYYAAMAVSDEPVYKYGTETPYTKDYKINEGSADEKAPSSVLNDDDYYVDKDLARPANTDVYPTEVAAPDFVALPEPEKPSEVKKPVAPEVVSEPVAPAAVAEPQKPAELARPLGVGDECPAALAAALASAYRQGELTARRELWISEPASLPVELTVEKRTDAESVTVTYHDEAGRALGDVTVDKGSLADIGYVPTRAESVSTRYVFDGWCDADGALVDLGAVVSDVMVYPHFREELKSFDITWLIDGIPHVEKAVFGSTPSFSGTPEKAGDFESYYEFVGWDKPITTVAADATYTAVFEKRYTVPTSGGHAAVTASQTAVTVACTEGDVDIAKLLPLLDRKLVLDFGELSASLSYSELVKMRSAGVARLSLESSGYELFADSEGGKTRLASLSDETASYELSLTAYLENGEPVSQNFAASLSASAPLADSSFVLYALVGGEKNYQRYTFSDGVLSFNLSTGLAYRFVAERSVTLVPCENASLTASVAQASAGDIVELSLSVPAGYELVALYYLDGGGVRHTVEGASFEMPASDVRVCVEVRRLVYTVTFVSDGITLSVRKYNLGDTVQPPLDPQKLDDDDFSYAFVGWSPAISPVTGDATYTAIYEATPKEGEEDGGLKISPSVLRILVTGGLLLVTFAIGLLPNLVRVAVILVRDLRGRHREKKTR